MKKLVVLLLAAALLGVGGYLLYFRVIDPDRGTCLKLAKLCAGGEDLSDRHLTSCRKGLEKLREVIGPEQAGKAGKCVAEARSCLGAAGCMTGAGLGGATVEFLNGMRRALQE